MTWPPLDSSRTEPSLPADYDRTALYLLPRDPVTLYAFWSLSNDTRRNWEQDRLRLRVYQIGQSQAFFDTAVGSARSWYITGVNPDASYQAELGYLKTSGEFTSIATSNPVHTPRDRFSDLTDANWLNITELYTGSRILRLQRGSEELLTTTATSISSPWNPK